MSASTETSRALEFRGDVPLAIIKHSTVYKGYSLSEVLSQGQLHISSAIVVAQANIREDPAGPFLHARPNEGCTCEFRLCWIIQFGNARANKVNKQIIRIREVQATKIVADKAFMRLSMRKKF